MLRVLYAFFVGLMLAIFVGVGIDAFYPQPESPRFPEVLNTPTPDKIDPMLSDAQLDARREYDRELEEYRVKSSTYNRNVSIIVLVAAVVFVTVSLLFDRRIQVIADGILLGGVFSLLYSIGRSFAAADSQYTFVVVTVGLVLAIALGYYRFIRQAGLSPVADGKSKTKHKNKKAGKK